LLAQGIRGIWQMLARPGLVNVDFAYLYSIVRGKNAESAGEAGRHHYPASGPTPGPIEKRAVTAGGEASRKSALDLVKKVDKQAGLMLFKFGEALHALQDSWSHQGTPDVPRLFDGAVACDPALVWAHPHARGGWNSHNADLTQLWPADTLAMAGATYELLLQYPAIDGVQRSAKPWASLAPQLDGLVRASTKTQKKKWFVGHGIAEVSFLEGITLPDGAETFAERWESHKLPALRTLPSRQHRVDPALLEFFSGFFERWISTDDFEAMAGEFAVPLPASRASVRGTPLPMDKAELASRLRVWRIRDHGRVAAVAHAAEPLTAAQRNSLSVLARGNQALARYAAPTEGFFPLLVRGAEPSPLLGFIVDPLPPAPNGDQRAVASTKFRHAPYDTVMVLAERREGRWRIVSLSAIVDH